MADVGTDPTMALTLGLDGTPPGAAAVRFRKVDSEAGDATLACVDVVSVWLRSDPSLPGAGSPSCSARSRLLLPLRRLPPADARAVTAPSEADLNFDAELHALWVRRSLLRRARGEPSCPALDADAVLPALGGLRSLGAGPEATETSAQSIRAGGTAVARPAAAGDPPGLRDGMPPIRRELHGAASSASRIMGRPHASQQARRGSRSRAAPR